MQARKILPFVFVAACLPALEADAQSVAGNVQPGYNSVTACGTGPSPCFVPYGQTMSITATIVGGNVTASQGGTWTVQPGNTPNTTPWLVTGNSAIVSASITRTANSTTYSANTAWANSTTSAAATEFVNACRTNGGQVLIPEVDIYSSYNPSTKLQGAVWFFSTQPGTLLNDNATFTIATADFAALTSARQGYAFTLTNTQASAAANSGATLAGTIYHGKCGASTTSMFAMVQVVNAYVPTASEVLTVVLHTIGAN